MRSDRRLSARASVLLVACGGGLEGCGGTPGGDFATGDMAGSGGSAYDGGTLSGMGGSIAGATGTGGAPPTGAGGGKGGAAGTGSGGGTTGGAGSEGTEDGGGDGSVDSAPSDASADVTTSDNAEEGSDAADAARLSDASSEGPLADDASDANDASEGSHDEADACAVVASAQNLAVGGTATASDPGDEGPGSVAKVFDDHTGTKWRLGSVPTPWMAYEFSGTDAHVVTRYTVTSANDGVNGNVTGDPQGWMFQGSNDGPGAATITWTTLDTRSAQTFATRFLTRAYSFVNTSAYHRYRLLVTANGGAPSFQISEWQLFGPGAPVFSVDDTVTSDDDPDNYFGFSNGWTGHTLDNASPRYSGSTSWSNVQGESLSVSFVGSQISLYGVKDPSHGIFAVSVDGGAETYLDLFGPLTFNTLVFTSPKLCSGRHSLTVRVTGDKNPAASDIYVSVDRVQVVP